MKRFIANIIAVILCMGCFTACEIEQYDKNIYEWCTTCDLRGTGNWHHNYRNVEIPKEDWYAHFIPEDKTLKIINLHTHYRYEGNLRVEYLVWGGFIGGGSVNATGSFKEIEVYEMYCVTGENTFENIKIPVEGTKIHYIGKNETPYVVIHEEFWQYWVCPGCGEEYYKDKKTLCHLYVQEGSIDFNIDFTANTSDNK